MRPFAENQRINMYLIGVLHLLVLLHQLTRILIQRLIAADPIRTNAGSPYFFHF